MSSLLEQASLVVTPNGTKASKLYSVKPTDGSGDMTVVRATSATRVNSSGLIESSAVNVPRLDYTGSTCPSILVEPQRTNLVTYSEDFNDTSWNVASTSTVTLNSGIAPNGTNTANLITATSVDGRRIKSLSLSAGTYTYSYFVKKGNQSSIQVLAFNSTLSAVAQYATFDLDNGTLTSGTGTIQQFTNGWYKVSVTFTIAATNTILLYIKSGLASNAIGSTVYAWGAQLEEGANATSYIPTTTASVTRNADLIYKTGISSLIGQTEGVFYAEIVTNDDIISTQPISLNDGTTSNRILLYIDNSKLYTSVTTGGTSQALISSSTILKNTKYKIAVGYKSNDIVFYVNGILIGTDTVASIPSCSAFSSHNGVSKLNSVAIWKTRLTNAELATLTTL